MSIEFADERTSTSFRRGQRVKYRENHKSFGAFIKSDQIRDVTAEAAGDIAQETASQSARSEGPGPHMADQWQVKRNAGLRKVSRNIRVRVDVFNPDIAAAAQEFGSGPRARQRRRTLGRVAARYGDFHPHGE